PGVPVEDAAIEVRHDDGCRNVLDGPRLPPQGLLHTRPIRDVAEAPDTPDDGSADSLRLRVALEDPAVLEFEPVIALGFGASVELADFLDEPLRVLQLIEHEREGLVVLAGRHDGFRDAPHLDELPVESDDFSLSVDDEDSV